jgi:hypothetical protein
MLCSQLARPTETCSVNLARCIYYLPTAHTPSNQRVASEFELPSRGLRPNGSTQLSPSLSYRALVPLLNLHTVEPTFSFSQPPSSLVRAKGVVLVRMMLNPSALYPHSFSAYRRFFTFNRYLRRRRAYCKPGRAHFTLAPRRNPWSLALHASLTMKPRVEPS